jgi:hypothetical protein
MFICVYVYLFICFYLFLFYWCCSGVLQKMEGGDGCFESMSRASDIHLRWKRTAATRNQAQADKGKQVNNYWQHFALLMSRHWQLLG